MANADYGEIAVDPAVLVETAEAAYRQIGAYRDGLEAASKLIASTREFWVGEAGDTFREIFAAEYAKAEEALAEYEKYPGELLKYHHLYSGIIEQADRIVGEVQEFSMT